MATQSGPRAEPRVPLTRERVLDAAVQVADEGGIAALTMRKLAQELGVEAMSLYYHVADKGEVLDGMANAVVEEINARVGEVAARADGADWKAVVRQRILTARDVILAHPWAPGVLESRSTMTPAALQYFDTLTGMLRAGGLSADLIHHALHALGSRALGFSPELFDSMDSGEEPDGDDATAAMLQMAQQYPNISEVIMAASHDAATTVGWCDDQFEFEFGLDLILDGLERLHEAA